MQLAPKQLAVSILIMVSLSSFVGSSILPSQYSTVTITTTSTTTGPIVWYTATQTSVVSGLVAQTDTVYLLILVALAILFLAEIVLLYQRRRVR